MKPAHQRLHVVGGGWAGLSAAIHGVRHGHEVWLHEMAPQLGGRARSVANGHWSLDNGQHILTGACTETLALLAHVGVDCESAFKRLPLRWSTPQEVIAPWLSHSSHLQRLWALLTASDTRWRHRMAWLHLILAMRLCSPRDWQGRTVADWLQVHATEINRHWLEALCLSALNTPADQACAQVFLNVIRASLSEPQASDLLLPKVGLSELLPKAAQWLTQHGAQIRTHDRIHTLDPLVANGQVVLACSSAEAARLTAKWAPDWSSLAQAIHHHPIATIYTRWPDSPPSLPEPLVFLQPGQDTPAQVVIDLGHLRGDGVHQGLWSWVASFVQLDRKATTLAIQEQSRRIWGRAPDVVASFLDPRATLACRPDLRRPPGSVCDGIWACGDYIESPFPSTLEGAVRSGRQVIERIHAQPPAMTN